MGHYKHIYFYIFFYLVLSVCPAQAAEREIVVDQMLDAFEDDSTTAETVMPDSEYSTVLNAQKVEPFKTPDQAVLKEALHSLDIKGLPLRNVFNEISQKAGLTLVASEQAQGVLTLSVEDISVAELLSVLAHVYGFAFDRQGDVIAFMTPADYQVRMGKEFQKGQTAAIVKIEQADLAGMEILARALKTETGRIFIDYKNRQIVVLDAAASVGAIKSLMKERDVIVTTKTIALVNVTIGELKGEVEKLIHPGLGKVEFNESEQSITVTDQPETVVSIVQFIQSQDQKIEVVLEGKIVRIMLNEEHADGVDWEAILSDYQQVELNGTGEESSNSHQIQFGMLSEEDFDVLLEALDTVGDVEDLMPIEIKAVSGQEQTFIIDTNNPFSSLMLPEKDFQLDPQGFKLNTQFMAQVVPLEKNISMRFLFQLFWMGGNVGDSGAVVIRAHEPVMFQVKSDMHLVFGGLLKRQTVSRTRKVPLLGDLPVLGGAFRRDRVHSDNAEYIIFLKPKIEKSGSAK